MVDAGLALRLQGRLDALTACGNAAGIHGAMIRIDRPGRGPTIALAAGRARADGDGPLTPDCPFHLASVAKTMTAVLVMQLKEAGLLDLDAPFARYGVMPEPALSQLPSGGMFTCRQLLMHIAGLRDGMVDDNRTLSAQAGGIAPGSLIGGLLAGDRGGKRWCAWDAERPDDADAGTINHYLIHSNRALGAAGAAFHYSDTGFVLMAILVEKLLGMPLHDALRERVFDPLHMGRSYLACRADPDLGPSREPEAEIWMGDRGLLATGVDLSFDWGGGGVVSTLADLNTFLIGLIGGALFEDAVTLREMCAWQSPEGLALPRTGVGLGLFRQDVAGVEMWGHSGAWGAKMFHAPAHSLFFSGTVNQALAPPDWHVPFIIEALAG